MRSIPAEKAHYFAVKTHRNGARAKHQHKTCGVKDNPDEFIRHDHMRCVAQGKLDAQAGAFVCIHCKREHCSECANTMKEECNVC